MTLLTGQTSYTQTDRQTNDDFFCGLGTRRLIKGMMTRQKTPKPFLLSLHFTSNSTKPTLTIVINHRLG